MLQNPRKTLGFKKNMVYKIPPGGGGKPYPASGLVYLHAYYVVPYIMKLVTSKKVLIDFSLTVKTATLIFISAPR